VVWETPFETAGDIHDSQSDFSVRRPYPFKLNDRLKKKSKKSPEFLSFINDAVAFVNSSTLFNGPATAFQTQILDALDQSSKTLVPSNSSEVVEGYKAVYSTIANKFLLDVAQVELLMSVMSPGVVSIQSAIQHPFRWGFLSETVFEIIIDLLVICLALDGRTSTLLILSIPSLSTPNTSLISRVWYPVSSAPFSISPPSPHLDLVTMRQGVKFVRTVGAAYGATFGTEITPGPTVQTDQQIEEWLVSTAVGTQFHPTGSCAMLPKSQGGVVNAKLQVYGLGMSMRF
jgi:hypothetical protein